MSFGKEYAVYSKKQCPTSLDYSATLLYEPQISRLKHYPYINLLGPS